MTTEETMTQLFAAEVDRLGLQQGLAAEERQRIVDTFRQILTNSALDDRAILRMLVGDAKKAV